MEEFAALCQIMGPSFSWWQWGQKIIPNCLNKWFGIISGWWMICATFITWWYYYVVYLKQGIILLVDLHNDLYIVHIIYILTSHLLNILNIAWYLLRLAFFTQHHSKIYPCLCIVHFTVYSIPLYIHTIYPFSSWWTFGLFPEFC